MSGSTHPAARASRLFFALIIAALTSPAIVPVPAVLAQEAADDLIEEILVTARRREESLQDVPVAISVLTDDFIQEATVLDHFDLYAETPGVEY